MKKRIVIVEDNTMMRRSLAAVIEENGNYVLAAHYGSCEEALSNIKKDHPSIVLMDVGLPDMDGIEGTFQIKKLIPSCIVLIITVQEDSDKVFRSLCAGADGYILKNSVTRELISAIDEALRGGAPMSLQIAKMVVQSFKRQAKSPLSEREHEVLQGISEGKSYSKIALDLFIGKETVRTHIKNIYLKLAVNSKYEAIRIAGLNKWINR